MEYDTSSITESKSATFNDAVAMVERLDILLKRIQDAKISPFQFNFDYGVYNYDLRIKSLGSHWQEVKPYCTDEEIELVERFRLIVPFKEQRLVYYVKNESRFNFKEYPELDKLLEFIESKQRSLQFIHGLSNPLKQKNSGL